LRVRNEGMGGAMRVNRVLVVAKSEAQALAGIERLSADKHVEMSPAAWIDAPTLGASGRFQLVIVVLGGEIGPAAATTFARSAERWARREALMLVALTDDGTAALHRDLQLAGFDDIIHKPMHKAQVSSRLGVLLRLSTMRRELARRQATARGFTNGEGLFLSPAEPVLASRRAAVLLVQFDQSIACAEQFSRAVRSCTEAQICDDPEAAHSMLYRGGLDAVLLCSGGDPTAAITFADRMRRIPALYNLPVLLATPDVAALDLDAVFTAGITDVAPTCLSSEQLSVHLASFKRLEALRSALAARYAQHVETVIRDGVTGFSCHGFGMAHLGETLGECGELGLPVAVASLKLGNLDVINAEHGYRIGDMVLRRLGDLVRRCIRGEDMATRLSGSRFLVQFPDTRYASARIAVQRLANVLRHQRIDLPEGAGAITLDISYNLAGWDGKSDARTLVEQLSDKRIAVAA
jgi:diguanylate cyclase (GGDEF)-like protein